MPLRGENFGSSVYDEAPYFETLSALDKWADKGRKELDGILPYYPRKAVDGIITGNKGKLLVCHDYKGGYTEKPDALAYTFNFWPYCESFVYFSHHRVTIPPSGWITAAHRHGVKMFGTLIFEGVGNEDCLRLLVGRPPEGTAGMRNLPPGVSLPLSPHYAKLLAILARQRGFDGWLLNFESDLYGGVEQARSLAAWISVFEKELKQEVGEHAEVIWYDSVVINGLVRWQNRLDNYNLPFFIPSNGFFSNYFSRPDYPSLTAQYFLTIDPLHFTGPRPKLLNDIYMGVDVWGRGSYGGGGFGSYKALQCIDPERLGLSAAIFGQAWSWETRQDEPGFTWDVWWDYERSLWVGPDNTGDVVKVPENESPIPLTTFFPRRPPPNPIELAFFTSFSPGVGRSWFVNGKKVLETKNGWTDVHKSGSIGDMLWPRPTLDWEHGDREEAPPKAQSKVDQDDAWIGGNSLNVTIAIEASQDEDAYFRCVWLPIQSLAITPQKTYEMYLIYKASPPDGPMLDIGLSVKALSGAVTSLAITSMQTSSALAVGWERLSIQFRIDDALPSDVLAAAGLVVGIAQDDPTQISTVSINLGSLAVYPARPPSEVFVPETVLPWAHFVPASKSSSPLEEVLTWSASSVFPLMPGITNPPSPEDPIPLWQLESRPPSLLYFNIYIQQLPQDGTLPCPDDAIFVGTTGLDGRANRFYVDPVSIPPELEGVGHVRFLVQGVTDRGEVLPWDRCTFADVKVEQ